MKLKDLKKAWNSLSQNRELNERQIREMLQSKTGNLIDRIDRNIRVGAIVSFALILFFIFYDLLFSSRILHKISPEVHVPEWIIFVTIFVNSLIIISLICFIIHYYRVKNRYDITSNLKEFLTKIIDTFRIYQRLFYLILTIIITSITLQFITGMFTGMDIGLKQKGIAAADVPMVQWILMTLVGLAVLVVIAGGVFLLLRWGFRRLYGSYIDKLKENLKELNEMEHTTDN